MNYIADLFISYAKNQKKSNDDQNEWIDNFIKYLEFLLERLIGKKPEILTSSSDNKKIDFNKIAHFILIINKEYLSSQKAITEYNQIIKTQNAISKIAIEPIAEKTNLNAFESFLSYNFYMLLKKDEGEETSFKLLNPQSDSQYWFKLIDLAYDIYQTLPSKLIQKKSVINQSKGIVFLAETTPDQNEYRDLVKKELQLHGYRILPNKPLPGEYDKLVAEVKNYLTESTLSVHIIGSEYGETIKNSELSKNELQNKIASEYYQENAKNIKKGKFFFRLIWIPPNIEIKDQKQFQFVEQLKRDIKMIEGTEIIQTPLEELKNIIYDKITNQDTSAFQKDSTADKKIKIYCIHEKEQTEQINIIKNILKKLGYEAIPTVFSEDEVENLEIHKKNLLQSDAVLIYYEKVNFQWISTKLKDLLKIPGYGKRQPFLAKGIITNNKLSLDDEILYKDFIILNYNGNINEKVFKPFFDKINK